MSAPVFTAVTSLQMIGFRKNNEAVFHVEVRLTAFTFPILIVDAHLKTTCVGLIPAVKEVTGSPAFE